MSDHQEVIVVDPKEDRKCRKKAGLEGVDAEGRGGDDIFLFGLSFQMFVYASFVWLLIALIVASVGMSAIGSRRDPDWEKGGTVGPDDKIVIYNTSGNYAVFSCQIFFVIVIAVLTILSIVLPDNAGLLMLISSVFWLLKLITSFVGMIMFFIQVFKDIWFIIWALFFMLSNPLDMLFAFAEFKLSRGLGNGIC